MEHCLAKHLKSLRLSNLRFLWGILHGCFGFLPCWFKAPPVQLQKMEEVISAGRCGDWNGISGWQSQCWATKPFNKHDAANWTASLWELLYQGHQSSRLLSVLAGKYWIIVNHGSPTATTPNLLMVLPFRFRPQQKYTNIKQGVATLSR